MRKVFKYELQIEDYQTLQLPWDSQILTVKAIDGRLFIWCLVDPDETRKVNCEFRLAGTGHTIAGYEAEHSTYVGTFFLPKLVFHLFMMQTGIQLPAQRVP